MAWSTEFSGGGMATIDLMHATKKTAGGSADRARAVWSTARVRVLTSKKTNDDGET